jgi:hypothetical protein
MRLRLPTAVPAAVLAAVAAAVAVPAPASAAVNACAATVNGLANRAMCRFVGMPGTYALTLGTTASYAKATAICNLGGMLVAEARPADGGHAVTTGELPLGECQLTVTMQPGTGATATATVARLTP